MIFSALELDGKIRLTERREEQNVVYKKRTLKMLDYELKLDREHMFETKDHRNRKK